LKNPLAIINNTTFSLQRAVVSGEQDVSKFTDIIREEVERTDRIITQVMGYARLTEGKLEKLNVTTAMDAAVQTVFPETAQFDVTIHRTYAPMLPPLMMQREHLEEILVNLLINAREAASGSLLIHLMTRRLPEGAVEMVVTDNGPGIARELQSRIFEAYYTTKAKGTGLGLAIVKNNVELYGGTVEVESELGKGTRFRLVLPGTLSPPSRV
jgi:two-component system NtrC family sensor kinase